MVTQFFKKFVLISGPSGPYIYLSISIYIYMAIYFFKKIVLLDLGTLGTLGTSYLSLWILLKIWNNSWDLRDLIYMAIYFLKKLFESRDLRDLICISLNLTKKLDQFWGSSGPYRYGYLFFKKIV